MLNRVLGSKENVLSFIDQAWKLCYTPRGKWGHRRTRAQIRRDWCDRACRNVLDRLLATGQWRQYMSLAHIQHYERSGKLTGDSGLSSLYISSKRTVSLDASRPPESNITDEKILRMAWKLSQGIDDRQDLVQEMYLRLWEKRAQYSGLSSYPTWARAVMANRITDLERKAKRQHVEIHSPESSVWQENDADPTDDLIARMDFTREVGRLPKKQAAVMVLHAIGEPISLSGLSNPTVYLRRAQKTLQTRLGEDYVAA